MSELNACEVVSMRPIEGETNTKAFADIRIGGGLMIHGCSVMNGRNGLFVNMPRRMGRDGAWMDVVTPLDETLRNIYKTKIMQAYEEKVTEKA